MKDLELISTNEIVFKLLINLFTILKDTSSLISNPNAFNINELKVEMYDHLYNEEPTLPNTPGIYTFSYKANIQTITIKIIGYRMVNKFRTSEIEYYKDGELESFMFDDLNSIKIKQILSKVNNLLGRISPQ